jgi:hypothetical protein
VRKPEVKRLTGRGRSRLVDNNKMDLREINWGCMELVVLAQDRDQWGGLLKNAVKIQAS